MKLFRILHLSASVTAVLALSAAAHAQIAVNATFSGSAPTAGANAFVQSVFNNVGNYFAAPTTNPAFNLNINVVWQDIDALGFAGASNYYLQNNVIVGQPLYRYLGGTPSVPGSFDINITLDNNIVIGGGSYGWDYTFGTPVSASTFSLASVVTHETFHGLDFLANVQSNGQFQSGFPTKFATFLEDASGNKLTNLTPAQRAAAATSDTGLFFNGTNATAAHGGQRIEMSAPSAFVDGSSGGSHTKQEQNYAPLMRPILFNGQYNAPSNVELAMMQDLGWNLNPATSTTPEASSVLLLVVGGGVIGIVARRRKKD